MKLRNVIRSVFALSLGLAAMGASAADNKGISTLDCRPLTDANTNLVFRKTGVQNMSDGNRQIVCPITRDQNYAYSQSEYGNVYVWVKAGGVDGSVDCTTYIGAIVAGGQLDSVSDTTGMVTKGETSFISVDMETTAGWGQVQMNVVCTLSPKMTVSHIYFNETGDTDAPPQI